MSKFDILNWSGTLAISDRKPYNNHIMLTTDHNYHRPILLKHTVPNSSPVTTVTLMSNTYLTLFEPSDRCLDWTPQSYVMMLMRRNANCMLSVFMLLFFC